MSTPSASPSRSGRASKRALYAVLAALAMAVYLLPLAATRLVGQDELKAHAQAALALALDRQVEVSGGVSLTLSPWFGLRTGPVTVANAPGFGEEPFLRMESAAISLDLTALLKKNVVVDSVSLASARVNLARDASGRENWIIAPEAAIPLPAAPEGWKLSSLPTGLSLENATLSFKDEATGLALDVTALNLKTSSSRPFDFSLSCKVTASPWGLAGEVHAQGQGSYGSSGGYVFVNRSKVAGWVELPPSLGVSGQKALFSGRLAVHGEGGAFEVADLAVEGLGAKITGQVNAAGLYEPVPYVHLDLAATAAREGQWARLLDLGRTGGEAVKAPGASSGPELRGAPGTGAVEARLLFGSTPSGWVVRRASLRDGEASLAAMAGDSAGEVWFDVDAVSLDLGRWLPGRLPGAVTEFFSRAASKAATGAGAGTLRGRIAARDLRLGLLEVEEAQVNAEGRGGDVRFYPVTARLAHSMFTADVRAGSDGEARTFTGKAAVQALRGSSGPGGAPATMLDLTLAGRDGPQGLAGTVRAVAAEHSKNWSPSWLSAEAAKAWAILGGGTLAASFSLPPGQDATLSLRDLDARTAHSRVTGSADFAKDKTTLDLQADQLDLERLTLLGSVWDKGLGGYAPWPVEARVAAKRFTAWNVAVDDLSATLDASPRQFRLPAVSGSALGGKFTGSLELVDNSGHGGGRASRSLSASLSATGVQAAQAAALRPDLPKLSGALDAKVSVESSADGGAPLWQGLSGQAEMRLGRGALALAQQPEGARPWPVDRAQASLRFALRATPASGQNGKAREAALADVSGSVRVDSPGMLRSSRMEIKGQAGLDASGTPLWLRQPKAEGALTLDIPFAPRGSSALISWSGRLDADFDARGFAAGPLELNVAGFPGRASVGGQPGKDAMELSGFVELPEFTPRVAAQRLGFAIPPDADQNSWRRARFAAEIGGNAKEVRLGKIQASLDDAAITGQAFVSGRATRLDLSVTTLDLDRLAPAPRHHDPAKRPEEPLPLAQLRELALEAKVRFGWLKKDRLIFQNAQTEFTARDGRFQLRQSAPDFYGGPYLMDIKGDARGDELKAVMDLRLTGFSPGPLLSDLAGADSVSGGRADFFVKVESKGSTDRALRRHAAGTAGFEVRGGALGGVRDVPARQPQEPVTLTRDNDGPRPDPPPQPGGLAFSRLGASFSIREGMAVTRDFVLTGAALSAKGDGWVNLDDEKIDLSLMARVPDVGDVPVHITGPLYDPKMDIDKSKVLGDTIVNMFKSVFTIPGSVLKQLRRVF